MTDTAPTKKAKILRDFRDHGTETNYTKDASVELSPGTFENFRAAGLVEEEAPAASAGGSSGKSKSAA